MTDDRREVSVQALESTLAMVRDVQIVALREGLREAITGVLCRFAGGPTAPRPNVLLNVYRVASRHEQALHANLRQLK